MNFDQRAMIVNAISQKEAMSLTNARSSGALHRQVRRMLILCIAAVVLLATSVGLGIGLYQEVRTRDQLLSNAAQMAADASLLTDTIRTDTAQQYLQRTVQRTAEVDMLGIYDLQGTPTAFYDLASGAGEASFLPTLRADTVSRLCSEQTPVLSSEEMPDGADRCAYAVVRDETGQATGIVMAGLYLRSYRRIVLRVLLLYCLITLLALGIGSLLSVRFSSRIKQELLGFEPDAFRQLFLQRMDILDALDEGLLAIDAQSTITYINRAAADILQIRTRDALGQPLRTIYPRSTMARVMQTGKSEYNISLESIKHVSILSDRMPLWRDGKIEGVIAIFRNRTEVTRLAQDLTGVQHIVEALRAYTHEFTNKLHVILGLLQLGEHKQAEDYVLRLTQTRAHSIGYISERIQEPSVAALLIGKSYRAAELGIRFRLDPASVLRGDGQYLPPSSLITILGNLTENAFEALRNAPENAQKEVTVSIREGEHGMLLSVDDSGAGIAANRIDRIFERGFSTKGEGRGTGLSLVKETVDAFHGTIRVESEPGIGSSFIITVAESADGQQ